MRLVCIGERKEREPALLPCTNGCGQWVKHVYLEERLVPSPIDGDKQRDEIYACEACGAERTWGCRTAGKPRYDKAN